jgi:hypothetical protein
MCGNAHQEKHRMCIYGAFYAARGKFKGALRCQSRRWGGLARRLNFFFLAHLLRGCVSRVYNSCTGHADETCATFSAGHVGSRNKARDKITQKKYMVRALLTVLGKQVRVATLPLSLAPSLLVSPRLSSSLLVSPSLSLPPASLSLLVCVSSWTSSHCLCPDQAALQLRCTHPSGGTLVVEPSWLSPRGRTLVVESSRLSPRG